MPRGDRGGGLRGYAAGGSNVKSELIIFLLIVAGNGAVALWKKWKERQVAQPTRPSMPPRQPARVPEPRVRERPDRRAEVERLRERARAKARAAAVAVAPTVRDAAPASPPRPTAVVRPMTTARAAAPRHATSGPLPIVGLDRASLRRAMLLHEILGPPRAVRPHG